MTRGLARWSNQGAGAPVLSFRAGQHSESCVNSEEGHMCPACIASTAVMVAGAGSTGGILALCIGKFRKFFRANRLGLFQKTKEK
jgi:hypothetical protein